MHGPPANDARLDEDDDWNLSDLLMSSAPNPRSALKDAFDLLCVVCEQTGAAKSATMADFVAASKEGVNLQQELPSQVAFAKSKAKKNCCLVRSVYALRKDH